MSNIHVCVFSLWPPTGQINIFIPTPLRLREMQNQQCDVHSVKVFKIVEGNEDCRLEQLLWGLILSVLLMDF